MKQIKFNKENYLIFFRKRWIYLNFHTFITYDSKRKILLAWIEYNWDLKKQYTKSN